MRLVRVFTSERSFTLTVSYLESSSALLKPISEKIIRSVRLSGFDTSQNIKKSASASGFWSNASEGFGAIFPKKPKKVSAATSQVAAYAYQSEKNFSNGGALYGITIVPLPSVRNESTFNTFSFLEMSNEGFVKSIGGDPRRAEAKRKRFRDGRKRLDYDLRFRYEGIPCRGRGFWIIDRGRVIRVSVSYTESLTSEEAVEVLGFLESFVILKAQAR